MKRIFAAYKDLVSIIYVEAPLMVVITFVCTVISGLLTPFSVYINKNILDGGLAVAMVQFNDKREYWYRRH